jgi:hypothetical protein
MDKTDMRGVRVGLWVNPMIEIRDLIMTLQGVIVRIFGVFKTDRGLKDRNQ